MVVTYHCKNSEKPAGELLSDRSGTDSKNSNWESKSPPALWYFSLGLLFLSAVNLTILKGNLDRLMLASAKNSQTSP